ncbi:hypothetical protein Tsubulata_000707 [Turnera subulata]|uniref:Uncharacterized protein n=1 Tax=Turnera subulata TaxID=218843 RepID=A0A9Q0FIS7_9ROSI|nr:hypothetical protein Tsubulata_000707 [Turnera subulata]
MAVITSLLESTPFKWKQHNLHLTKSLPPLRPIPHRNLPHPPLRLSTKCLSSPNHSPPLKLTANTRASSNLSSNPFQEIRKTLVKVIEHLKKPALAAILIGALLLYDLNSAAFAASAGRMGGSSFSSRSSSSSSRSYSVPRDSVSGFSYSTPYYAPSPFGGSGYMGPAVGVGVGGGSSLFFILAGFAAFMLVSGFLSDRRGDGVLTATEKTTVLKLQVGLLGMGRALQKDLNRIAENADTSSPQGLAYVLTETSLALLRHPDYCISGYSSVDVKRSLEDGEKRFNQLSIEERGKFDEETLVNVNSIRKQSSTSQRANGFSNEYIVITILVAAEGVHKLPTINSGGDLKSALQKLGSIPSSKILAVEVLWTPQNENDSLSERELLEDYPLLRAL